MELPSEPGLYLNVYTAAAGTPTADALKMLGSWVASQEHLPTEAVLRAHPDVSPPHVVQARATT